MSVQHYGKLNNGKIDADMLTLIKSIGVLFHRIRLILVLTKHNVLYLIIRNEHILIVNLL